MFDVWTFFCDNQVRIIDVPYDLVSVHLHIDAWSEQAGGLDGMFIAQGV